MGCTGLCVFTCIPSASPLDVVPSGHLQRHLLHPHAWVRLASAQMFGILFGAWTVDEVIAVSSRDRATDTEDVSYIEDDLNSWVSSLSHSL